VKRWALTLLLLALFVCVWQVVASLPGVDRLILASPGETARALGDDRSLLLDNAWVTLEEAVLGLAIAVAFGAAAALGMHLVRPLRDAAYPLLVGSQAIPVLVFAPLLVLAFDYGIGPKIVIVSLICFFPITVNLLDGLRATDPDLLKLMRSLGASRAQTLRKVELPACLPHLFTGLRLAATVSVIGAVFGEWSGAESPGGIGWLVMNASHQLETPRTYAGVVILTAMAVTLFALVTLLERVAVPWNRRQGGRTA
jgi:ABC-type nitrate/sulfonate/bicarbonate transport system permease component